MTNIKITPPPMTSGQVTQINRFLTDGVERINLSVLPFSKAEAQQILKDGDLANKEIEEAIKKILRKYATIRTCFGPALVEFELIVPEDYDHGQIIDLKATITNVFKNTSYYNEDLNSKNYANSTQKLMPGEKYQVKIYPILRRVASADCIKFLEEEGATFVGAQGLILAQSIYSEHFPKDSRVLSFDVKEALWQDPGGKFKVPFVFRSLSNNWDFNLEQFDSRFNNANYCLISFTKK